MPINSRSVLYFPSFSEGLSLRRRRTTRSHQEDHDFPSFSEGLSLRLTCRVGGEPIEPFPFLFGGTFIEARLMPLPANHHQHFPSFSEGLSLRRLTRLMQITYFLARFPFLFGGTFIEATEGGNYDPIGGKIPFLLGRAFIEATCIRRRRSLDRHFPSI